MRQKLILPTLLLALLLPAGCSNDDSGTASLFEVLIENTATPTSLTASNGAQVPIVFSPVVAVLHSTPTTPFFTLGASAPGNGLESYAEDADPSMLLQQLSFADGVSLVGLANVSQQTQATGILPPGESFRVVLSSQSDSDRLSMVLGFTQSNDVIAANLDGVPLYDANGTPITADITSAFTYIDAGTEVNQEPGLGADQIPRQADPNTGAVEGGAVRGVDDGFTYPAVGTVLRITVKPLGEAEI